MKVPDSDLIALEELPVFRANHHPDPFGVLPALTQRAGELYGQTDPDFPRIWRYPSSALPGTNNLVVFGPLWMAAYQALPASPEGVPGSLIARAARPPRELDGVMRHQGEPHPGLLAHLEGRIFTLNQPLSFAP